MLQSSSEIPRVRPSRALDAYRDLLEKPSALSEDQFKTYISLVGEAIDTLLAGDRRCQDLRGNPNRIRGPEEDSERIRMKEWEAVGLLRKEIVPELARRLALADSYSPDPYRFSRNVEGRDLLLLAAWIPDSGRQRRSRGCSASSSNNDHLSKGVLNEAVAGAQWNDGGGGRPGRPRRPSPLSGRRSPTTALPLATEYFEDGFPPWKIELFQAPAQGVGDPRPPQEFLLLDDPDSRRRSCLRRFPHRPDDRPRDGDPQDQVGFRLLRLPRVQDAPDLDQGPDGKARRREGPRSR